MTRGSKTLIVPPLQGLKSSFHKRKDKKVNKLNTTFQTYKFEHFESTPEKKGISYETGTKSDTDDDTKVRLKKWLNHENDYGRLQEEDM